MSVDDGLLKMIFKEIGRFLLFTQVAYLSDALHHGPKGLLHETLKCLSRYQFLFPLYTNIGVP